MSRNQKETPPLAKRVERGIALICAAVVNGLIIPPGTFSAPGRPAAPRTHRQLTRERLYLRCLRCFRTDTSSSTEWMRPSRVLVSSVLGQSTVTKGPSDGGEFPDPLASEGVEDVLTKSFDVFDPCPVDEVQSLLCEGGIDHPTVRGTALPHHITFTLEPVGQLGETPGAQTDLTCQSAHRELMTRCALKTDEDLEPGSGHVLSVGGDCFEQFGLHRVHRLVKHPPSSDQLVIGRLLTHVHPLGLPGGIRMRPTEEISS